MTDAPVAVWFRQDLRLEDNPAWAAAARSGRPVLPLFVWAPEDEGAWRPGRASSWWLHLPLAWSRRWRRVGSRWCPVAVFHRPCGGRRGGRWCRAPAARGMSGYGRWRRSMPPRGGSRPPGLRSGRCGRRLQNWEHLFSWREALPSIRSSLCAPAVGQPTKRSALLACLPGAAESAAGPGWARTGSTGGKRDLR